METIREENPTIRENSTIRETLNTPKINVSSFRDYEVIEELDNIGAEADIYIIQKNNQKYFLKLYRKGIELKDDVFEKIKNIDSEYFIKLIEYGFDETTQRFYEISEYIKAQTLNKNIDIDYFIKALNEALNILHQNQIIHHDLKPNNILVINSKIKLIDFGVSTILENEFTKKLTSIKGTYSYFSPESISGYVGKEIDYWSFGIIVLELLDKNPFAGLNQTTIIHYLATKPIPIPKNLPQKYQILLKGLLTKDPHKRWGYNEIKLWLENRFSNVYYEEIELPKYKFNNQELTLQELAQEFLKPQNFELAQKHIARGYITKFLEKIEDFDFVIKLDEYEKVVEKLIYFCYSQNPTLPFSLYGKIIDEEFIFNLFLKKMKNELDKIDNKILDILLKTDTITIYEQTTNNNTNLKEFIFKFDINNLGEFFRIENILKQDEKIVSLMFKYIQKDRLSQYDIKSILDFAIQKDNIQLFSEYYKLYEEDFSKYLEYIYNNGLDFNVVVNSNTSKYEIIKFLINKDKNLILKYFSKSEIVEFLKDNLEYTKELFEFVRDEDLSYLLDKAIEKNNKEIGELLLDRNIKSSENSDILNFLINNNLLDKYKNLINYKKYVTNNLFSLKETLKGDTDNISSIFITNNNKYIIYTENKFNGKNIKIWDFQSNKYIETLNIYSFEEMTITHDSKYIIYAEKSFNDKIKINIYDIEKNKNIKTLEDVGAISSIVTTYDDKYIIYGYRGAINILDIESEECIKTLDGHTSYITGIIVTYDNKYIVSKSRYEDRTIKIGDIESGECIKTLEGHTDYITSIAITHNNKYIISGSEDSTIKIWDFKTGKCINTLKGHTNHVRDIIITSDDKYLISICLNKVMKIWDFKTTKCIKTLDMTDDIKYMTISHDDKYIICGDDNGIIKIWNFEKTIIDYLRISLHQFDYNTLLNIIEDKVFDLVEIYENLYKHNKFEILEKLAIQTNTTNELLKIYIENKAFDYINTTLLKNLNLGYSYLKELIKNNILEKYKDIVTYEHIKNEYTISIDLYQNLKGHTGDINSVTITNDNRYVVSGSADNTIKVWDFKTAKCIKTLNNKNTIESIAITNDNKYIIVGNRYPYLIKIWDIKSGECIKTLKGQKKSIKSIIITNDDKYIIAKSEDFIKVWDIKSGKYIKTLEGGNYDTKSVVITNDDKYIIAGGYPDAVKIWNIKSGKCIKTLKSHRNNVYSVAITNDNKYIISGSWDSVIKIWDFQTGKCIKTLEGHECFINSIVITHDNRYIISGSADNTIKVWDFESGKCIKTLENHTDSVNSIVITNDNKYIISGSDDKTINIWEIKKNLGDYLKNYLYQFDFKILLNLIQDRLIGIEDVYKNLYKYKKVEVLEKLVIQTNRQNELLKMYIENEIFDYISDNLLENVKLEFEDLKTLIANNLLPKNIIFKNNNDKYNFFEFLLNNNPKIIGRYFNYDDLVEFLKNKTEYILKLYSSIKKEDLSSFLDILIDKKEIKIVKFLLDKNIKTNSKNDLIKLFLNDNKLLVDKYLLKNDIVEFIEKNIEYTKELYEFVKDENLIPILNKAIENRNIEIVKFLLLKNILPSDFNKDKLLKLLLENSLFEYIYRDLYKFVNLESIDYKYLKQLIIYNLIPEKINFKYDYQKITFIEFLLKKDKNLIRKYFDIEYLIVNFTQIENKQDLFLVFSIEEKHMLFNKLKTNNIPLLIKIYKNESKYLPKLKQILKKTKDKEIKELFYKNGIKLSFSEKLFGIKE